MSLVGCKDEETTTQAEDDFEFEYKFKEEYSDKINSGLAEAFIDFTRDTLTIYLNKD